MVRNFFAALGICSLSTEEASRRISNFSFDDVGTERPLKMRLMLKKGWDDRFTELAIEEYRKFLLIVYYSTQRGEMVVPSEVIDEVWHEHLLDSPSYWGRLCRETLYCDLHHRVAKSAGSEAICQREYRQTFGRYQSLFNSVPPKEIWGELPPAPAFAPTRRSSSSRSRVRHSRRTSDTVQSSSSGSDSVSLFTAMGSTASVIASDGGGSAPAASCGGGSSAAGCGGGGGAAAGCGGGGAAAGCGGGS